MMASWEVELTGEAKADLRGLGQPRGAHVRKALVKVSRNPLPHHEGGYGAPLGNRRGADLTGLLKVKLRGDGIRIVYRLERAKGRMVVVIVGVRDDYAVYEEAARRLALN